jgi:hypothetical protein
LLNLFAAPDRGPCCLPSPVGGWFLLGMANLSFLECCDLSPLYDSSKRGTPKQSADKSAHSIIIFSEKLLFTSSWRQSRRLADHAGLLEGSGILS